MNYEPFETNRIADIPVGRVPSGPVLRCALKYWGDAPDTPILEFRRYERDARDGKLRPTKAGWTAPATPAIIEALEKVLAAAKLAVFERQAGEALKEARVEAL
jgi:hypothetical protein